MHCEHWGHCICVLVLRVRMRARLWSAALPQRIVDDIYEWNRHNRLMMRLGVLSGTGSDCCGTNLMSFTAHGWGYGLLRNDMQNAYLLNLYSMSSHAMTRGTWTAFEEADIQGGGTSGQ